jgi:bla regulator protein blaR1
MTIYLLKVVFCSALFLGCYFLLFQREKIYRFNRFYLLFSLVAPFIIPFIEIQNGSTPISIPQVENVYIPLHEMTKTTSISEVNVTEIQESTINFPVLIYVLVSSILLFIFLKNIFVLIKEIRNNEKIVLKDFTVVLLEKKNTPYSFMKYVFVNSEEYEKQGIEKEILLHESTHIEQVHSIDILLIELMKVFLWFNPLIFFYKKAMQLNHEFLADEAVINKYENVTNYQYLLIKKASQPNRFLFTSSFNYSITKQRLKMMTKSTSKTKALLITLAFVPLFACAIFMFSTKIYAQKSVMAIKEKEPIFTKEGASDEMIAEYHAIIRKYLNGVSNGADLMERLQDINKNAVDKEMMKFIANAMSKEQKSKQNIMVMGISDYVSPKEVPTEKEFENFKDPTKYGVWVDGKKIKNSELNKYKASDFSNFGISKLYGAAKYDKGVKRIYGYQLDMMTSEYYEKYKEETLTNPEQHYMVRNMKMLKAGILSK